MLKKAYLIYTHMACILKTLDFIYSLYRNKAKKNPLKITRMNAQISSWGVTLEIEAQGNQHKLVFDTFIDFLGFSYDDSQNTRK